jgi:ABC-type lipoprotein release transport system permease subunit
MTLKDLAKTSFGNLGRHKARTALSAVGVTVGILTIVTMLSLGVGVQQEVIRVFQSAGLETVRVSPVTEDQTLFTQFTEPGRTVLITPALVEEMRARDDVVKVSAHIYVPRGANASLRFGENMIRVYVGGTPWLPSEPFTMPPELVAGEELTDGAQGEIVVNASALEALGYEETEFGDLIGQEIALVLKAPRGDVQDFPLRLVGIIDAYDDLRRQDPRAYLGATDTLPLKAWWYNDPDILEREGYDALTIKAASLNDAVQIVDQLEARNFDVESLRTILDTVNKTMVVLQTMLGSIGGLALLVASIGIANTMIMSVYERTREIGILKAIGASPGDIRLLFMAEASLIGLLGGVTGAIGGWLLGLGLNEGILAYLRWREIPVTGTFFVVTGWLVALALVFAMVVGLLAGLYPAARAARLDPLEALRYE